MKKYVLFILLLLCSFVLVGCNPNSYREKRNIILVIGDGMGESHIKGGEFYSNKTFNFTKWVSKAYSNTTCLNSDGSSGKITDSAAAATALATGELTLRSKVGQSYTGTNLNTILDYAKQYNMLTGVVSTDYLYGATPAGFSGHASDRDDSDTIIQTELTSEVDLLIGAYNNKFNSYTKQIYDNGYTLNNKYNPSESELNGKKVLGLVEFDDYGKNITLKSVVEKALDFLSSDENGFVLIVEQAHIDKHAHYLATDGQFESVLKAVNSLNDTVDFLETWAIQTEKETGTKTLIIVTSDHETGGLTVSTSENLGNKACNIFYNYTTGDHTSTLVPIFSNFKIDFSKYSNYSSNETIKNTNTFDIMKDYVKRKKLQVFSP